MSAGRGAWTQITIERTTKSVKAVTLGSTKWGHEKSLIDTVDYGDRLKFAEIDMFTYQAEIYIVLIVKYAPDS